MIPEQLVLPPDPAQQIDEIYSVFVKSVERYTLTLVEGDHQNEVRSFISKVIFLYKPYAMIWKETIPNLIQDVFTREPIQDFVWGVSFYFDAFLGTDEVKRELLINTLVNACCLCKMPFQSDEGEFYGEQTPDVYLERLPVEKDIHQLLMNNKWIVVLMLLNITVNMDSNSELREMMNKHEENNKSTGQS